MHILINGSQKVKESNSIHFLKYISKYLDKYEIYSLKEDDYEEIIEKIKEADNIVVAFPLYVDSPNTLTLSFLDYVIDNNIAINKNIYFVINCGFLEGEQNITALNIVKNWADKVKAACGGSVLIGAGEVAGVKRFKFLSGKVFKNLKRLGQAVNNNGFIGDNICRVGLLTKKLFCKIANISWNRQGKANGLTKNNLYN